MKGEKIAREAVRRKGDIRKGKLKKTLRIICPAHKDCSGGKCSSRWKPKKAPRV